MKRENILIPKPKSNFWSVQCTSCKEKQVIFSHATSDINCKSCGNPIAKKTGGRANVLGEILTTLD
ncbi:MAG TPA: 30S ribosomal protein S27e [Nitrososphaeraceae archaeon]|jgi:small subunit ribosomal protein S27e|nr:30S ribosomal protein S27e [Nitrososphaeraceae archaeon]